MGWLFDCHNKDELEKSNQLVSLEKEHEAK